MISLIRYFNRNLNIRAIKKHRSRLGWRHASRYTKYWQKCKKSYHKTENNTRAYKQKESLELSEYGVTSFITKRNTKIANDILSKIKKLELSGRDIWSPVRGSPSAHRSYNGDCWIDFPEIELFFRNDVGRFLENYFECNFKIFYSSMFKSVGHKDDEAVGSQLWHSDGGPGTCIIVAIYLNDTDKNSGCLEALDWPTSLKIFNNEKVALDSLIKKHCLNNAVPEHSLNRTQRREILCDFYGEQINRYYKHQIKQPCGAAGLVVPFSNNNIHKGGLPKNGQERYVILTHIYPEWAPTPFGKYRSSGLLKKDSYPFKPDF